MKSNQVHIVTSAVSCDLQQFIHAREPRFMGQIVRDVSDGDRRNRFHDDVTFVHPVTTTYLHMRTYPDPNATSDSSASDALTKVLGKDHIQRFFDRRTGVAPRSRAGFDAPFFTVFCQASVTASPSVSS